MTPRDFRFWSRGSKNDHLSSVSETHEFLENRGGVDDNMPNATGGGPPPWPLPGHRQPVPHSLRRNAARRREGLLTPLAFCLRHIVPVEWEFREARASDSTGTSNSASY